MVQYFYFDILPHIQIRLCGSPQLWVYLSKIVNDNYLQLSYYNVINISREPQPVRNKELYHYILLLAAVDQLTYQQDLQQAKLTAYDCCQDQHQDQAASSSKCKQWRQIDQQRQG